VIREHIRRPLAEELLFGNLTGGGHVTVRVGKGDELELVAQSLIESETVD
jgi:ATP-dependent Clp protease ATP-binding subunit ClpA